jgi:hypothetical protein
MWYTIIYGTMFECINFVNRQRINHIGIKRFFLLLFLCKWLEFQLSPYSKLFHQRVIFEKRNNLLLYLFLSWNSGYLCNSFRNSVTSAKRWFLFSMWDYLMRRISRYLLVNPSFRIIFFAGLSGLYMKCYVSISNGYGFSINCLP